MLESWDDGNASLLLQDCFKQQDWLQQKNGNRNQHGHVK